MACQHARTISQLIDQPDRKPIVAEHICTGEAKQYVTADILLGAQCQRWQKQVCENRYRCTMAQSTMGSGSYLCMCMLWAEPREQDQLLESEAVDAHFDFVLCAQHTVCTVHCRMQQPAPCCFLKVHAGNFKQRILAAHTALIWLDMVCTSIFESFVHILSVKHHGYPHLVTLTTQKSPTSMCLQLSKHEQQQQHHA